QQERLVAWELSLSEEHAKAPGDQQPEKIQKFTIQRDQLKAENLMQINAFLARYPWYKTLFTEQQTIDPNALLKFAAQLPARTLAVQYFAAPNNTLYLIVVAPGMPIPQAKTQPVSRQNLQEWVDQ